MSDTVMLLKMAASLPCDPRHKMTLLQAAEEIEALQAENERLKAEWDSLVDQRIVLMTGLSDMTAECDRLAAALRDAGTSLQTIADTAGKDVFIKEMLEVRGYANSRARVAKEALTKGRGD